MEAPLLRNLKTFDDFFDTCLYFGIELNNQQLGLFKKYHEILTDWNKKINLISRGQTNQIFTNDPILEKHFLDSLLFLPEIELSCKEQSRLFPICVFDLGSGGGFPAIPFSILKTDWKFTLCEATKKKASFLSALINELKLKNVEVIPERAEEICKEEKYYKKYDLFTARAVAKLDELIKYAHPFLKENGHMAFYKGNEIEDEIKQTEKLIKKYKLEIKIFEKEINNVSRKLIIF